MVEERTLKAIAERLSQQALDRVITDPKRVSAEYTALLALRDEDRLENNPQVVLIHTDTLGGRAAAIVIRKALSKEFNAQVECVECSMNVNDRSQLRYNLGDFMQKVATCLKDHDKHTTCFAPLGGFKVMTSLGYLAGAYLGFPTLYTHEDNQIVHEVPAIPVRVPPEELLRLAPLLSKIGNGAELQGLTPDEQALVEEHAWLFERAGGIVCVNAFGLFLMQQNPALFAIKLIVSKDVDDEYKNDGRRDFIRQQLGVLGAKLTAGSVEADLRHERDWEVAENDGWHLYKGASNGQQVMRAIYRFEQDTLTIKHVWTSHDYVEDFRSKWPRRMGEAVEWSLS